MKCIGQKLLEHLIHARVHGVIEMVSSLVEQGKDLSQFVNEFIWYLRNAMVLMTAAEAEELVDLPADAISAPGGNDQRSGYGCDFPIYPHLVRRRFYYEIQQQQKSGSGSGTDQTVQTSDGRGL